MACIYAHNFSGKGILMPVPLLWQARSDVILSRERYAHRTRQPRNKDRQLRFQILFLNKNSCATYVSVFTTEFVNVMFSRCWRQVWNPRNADWTRARDTTAVSGGSLRASAFAGSVAMPRPEPRKCLGASTQQVGILLYMFRILGNILLIFEFRFWFILRRSHLVGELFSIFRLRGLF